jgi:hypothetical protein
MHDKNVDEIFDCLTFFQICLGTFGMCLGIITSVYDHHI